MTSFIKNFLRCLNDLRSQILPRHFLKQGFLTVFCVVPIISWFWAGWEALWIEDSTHSFQETWIRCFDQSWDQLTQVKFLNFLLFGSALSVFVFCLLCATWGALFLKDSTSSADEIWLSRLNRLWTAWVQGYPRLRKCHLMIKRASQHLNQKRFGMFLTAYIFNRLCWMILLAAMGLSLFLCLKALFF